jgi:predicted flap endonuclease-1-like 5' DNA nuclease
LALFWQIVVFLLVAAALGFVIGWVTRGARALDGRAGTAPRQGGVAASLADERDRLRTELAAARAAQDRLEASLAEARELAETRAARVRGLEEAQDRSRERIARLEQELSAAREASSSQGGPESGVTAAAIAPEAADAALPTEPVQGAPPSPLPAPEGAPDDLKQISGIGPSIEKTLHELGIYHFRQIAQFTPDNVAWIDQRLRFRGRIEREDWIGQAKRLASGQTVDQV